MRKAVIAFVCSSVLAVFFVLAWTVISQDANSAGVGDSCLTIHACAFQEGYSEYSYQCSSSLYMDSGSGTFQAPVHLPQGAVIKKIRLICFDNNASKNIKMWLYRQPASKALPYELGSVSSYGSEANIRDFGSTVISPRYVNNLKNAYYVSVELPGTESDGYEFNQAKIIYEAP